MCGERCPTGCRPSDGSFSTRVMWRQGGELVSYMYLPDREENCGEDWQWDVEAGDKFKEVRIYNRVNDARCALEVSQLYLSSTRAMLTALRDHAHMACQLYMLVALLREHTNHGCARAACER